MPPAKQDGETAHAQAVALVPLKASLSSDPKSLLVTTSESRACCLPQRQPVLYEDSAARGSACLYSSRGGGDHPHVHSTRAPASYLTAQAAEPAQ